jgi:hypothetical protein
MAVEPTIEQSANQSREPVLLIQLLKRDAGFIPSTEVRHRPLPVKHNGHHAKTSSSNSP